MLWHAEWHTVPTLTGTCCHDLLVLLGGCKAEFPYKCWHLSITWQTTILCQIWLRTGTGGGLLCIRWWTFGFHEMRGISWVAKDILASQEGLCSM
jgi:hypothetical protein